MIVHALVLGLLLNGPALAEDTIHRGPVRPMQWQVYEPAHLQPGQAEVDNWFGEDKIKHFAFSFAITAAVAGAARLVTAGENSAWTGAAFGLAAGVGKELYDQKTRNAASLRDLIWDLAGVGAGVLLMQQVR